MDTCTSAIGRKAAREFWLQGDLGRFHSTAPLSQASFLPYLCMHPLQHGTASHPPHHTPESCEDVGGGWVKGGDHHRC